MSRLPHPLQCHISNYAWQRVQIMQLLIMQFCPHFCLIAKLEALPKAVKYIFMVLQELRLFVTGAEMC
jgi:hypothetical protein